MSGVTLFVGQNPVNGEFGAQIRRLRIMSKTR